VLEWILNKDGTVLLERQEEFFGEDNDEWQNSKLQNRQQRW
jgi:hypothetical protein